MVTSQRRRANAAEVKGASFSLDPFCQKQSPMLYYKEDCKIIEFILIETNLIGGKPTIIGYSKYLNVEEKSGFLTAHLFVQ